MSSNLEMRNSLSRATLDRIQQWRDGIASPRDRGTYVREVNEQYDRCANHVRSPALVELRLARSLWAKKIAEFLVINAAPHTAGQLVDVASLLGQLRILLTDAQVQRLITLQHAFGDGKSADALAALLCEHAAHEIVTRSTSALSFSPQMLKRLGPTRLTKLRPIRKRGNFDPNAWLNDASMSRVEFVDGDPDRVRVRGLELHSGDIGIVELNEPGDGVLECFLEEPGLAPHAMLYVTRRVADPNTKSIYYQPCAVEIFEGGWRCVPITTALHSSFSWHSEWVRPRDGDRELPADIGARLSSVLDDLEIFAFDFQSRKVPPGGWYNNIPDGSTATCSNFVRVPFERSGVTGMPYPTTAASVGAQANLSLLGLCYPNGIYTPTNILNDSKFSKVGIVDNGQTERSYASALVIGRPDWPHSFGGWIAQKNLCLDNLPHWRSVRNWRSSFEALKVKLGQSSNFLGRAARGIFNVTEAEVPKSASETAIAYYLRTAFEAGHIITKSVTPALDDLFSSSEKIWSIEELHAREHVNELCAEGISHSCLQREHWYC